MRSRVSSSTASSTSSSKCLPWRTSATPVDPEAGERARHGLPLRIEDLRFRHHVHHHSGHGCAAYEPAGLGGIRAGVRPSSSGGGSTCVDIDTLAALRPGNIEEALDAMREGLHFFHESHDRRAIFLRLYYKMTLEVYAAIHGCGEYKGRRDLHGTGLDPPALGPVLVPLLQVADGSPRGTARGDRARASRSSPARRSSRTRCWASTRTSTSISPAPSPRTSNPPSSATTRSCRSASSTTTRSTTCWSARSTRCRRCSPRTTSRASASSTGSWADRRAGVRRAAATPTASGCGGTRSPSPPRGRARSRRSSATSWNGSPRSSPKRLRNSRLWGAERPQRVNRAFRRLVSGRWATVPLERRCHDHRHDPAERAGRRNRVLRHVRVSSSPDAADRVVRHEAGFPRRRRAR